MCYGSPARKLLKGSVSGSCRRLSIRRCVCGGGLPGKGMEIHELREAACSKGLFWLVTLRIKSSPCMSAGRV